MSEQAEVPEGVVVETVGDRVRVIIPVPRIGKHVYIMREGGSPEAALRLAEDAIAHMNEKCERTQPIL